RRRRRLLTRADAPWRARGRGSHRSPRRPCLHTRSSSRTLHAPEQSLHIVTLVFRIAPSYGEQARRAAPHPATRRSSHRPDASENAMGSTVICSADDHLDLVAMPPTLWQERLPRDLRDRGPRVEDVDGHPMWIAGG